MQFLTLLKIKGNKTCTLLKTKAKRPMSHRKRRRMLKLQRLLTTSAQRLKLVPEILAKHHPTNKTFLHTAHHSQHPFVGQALPFFPVNYCLTPPLSSHKYMLNHSTLSNGLLFSVSKPMVPSKHLAVLHIWISARTLHFVSYLAGLRNCN